MTKVPDDLHYTKDHEWVRIEGKKATVGITDHAQHELTDIVFVELPKVGKVLKAGDVLGVVESVKSASEIYAPISGKVLEVNGELLDSPEVVNKDPYGKGWIAKIEAADPSEEKSLLNASSYKKQIGE
jgi:glycine cleavage system H protein